MALEVYINGRQIELLDEKSIGQTFQVGSILNPNNRKGNLTNKFKAPKTRNNNEILGTLSNINSDSNIPYQLNKGKTIQNGIELISNGFTVVDGTGEHYDLVIYSGNTNFFDLIEDLNVKDLDWNVENHAFNHANILSSWNRDKGYIYPIINWGEGLNTSTTLDFRSLIACTFFKTVADKTMNLIGYSLAGTFTEQSEFERLLMTPTDWGLTDQETYSLNGVANHNTSQSTQFIPIDTGGYEEVVLNSEFQAPFYNFQFTSSGYTPHQDTVGYFIVDANVGAIGEHKKNRFAYLQIKVLKDGVVISDSGQGTVYEIPQNRQAFTNVSHSHTTEFFELSADSVYTVEYSIFANKSDQDYILTVNNQNYQLRVEIQGFIQYSDVGFVFKNLFDYNLKKVWKDVINLYGLIIQTNDVTRQVSLNRLKDLSLNIHLARDWSDKIDLSKPINIKYRLDSFGQVNNFLFAEDDEVANTFGDGEILVSDVNLKKEQDIIQLNASAAETGQYDLLNYQGVPTIPFRSSIFDVVNEKNIRFLMLDGVVNPVTLKDTSPDNSGDIAVADMPYCYFQKTGRNDSLDFSNGIVQHYSALSSMLTKTKFISAFFILQEIDVVGFDFSIPVFINVNNNDFSINGYFYVDKIANFKDNNSTICNLIRL